MSRTRKAPGRIVTMAKAIASSIIGGPVAWADLPESARLLWMQAAQAAHEADRIAPRA